MAVVRHLGVVGGSCGTTHEGPFRLSGVKIVTIGLVVLKLNKFDVCRLRLKVLFMSPKFQFWGLTPKIWRNIVETAKRHIVAQNDAFLALVGPDRTRHVVALCKLSLYRHFPLAKMWSTLGCPADHLDVRGKPH